MYILKKRKEHVFLYYYFVKSTIPLWLKHNNSTITEVFKAEDTGWN